MAKKVTKGSKVQFQVGDADNYADSVTWVKVAQLMDITLPKIKADDIDTSNMDDAVDQDEFKTSEPGWAEAGEVQLSLQFKADQAATLYGLFRQTKGYRAVYPDGPSPSGAGSIWRYNGYINEYGDKSERAGVITQEITVKIVGKPDFVPADNS